MYEELEVFDELAVVRQRAVEIALIETAKNVREVGAENRGPEIDKYHKNAYAPLEKNYEWCGIFVYYCLSQAAKIHGKILPFNSGTMWSGQKVERWSMKNPSKIVGTMPVLPGDFYVMNNYHIGLVVEKMADNGVVQAVDGNQSQADTGKNSLRRTTRHLSDMRLIIRI